MKYLDKCKEEELFEEFVDFYIKSFKYGKDHNIRNINDMFTQMTLVKFEDNEKNTILFNNWKSSFEELDGETKKLFSHHMSLYINRLILNEVQDYCEYESKRLEVKNRPDQVIVYAYRPYCSNSRYTSIDVISFLSYFFNQQNNVYDRIADAICDECFALMEFGISMKDI
jgi:hypothetical protein